MQFQGESPKKGKYQARSRVYIEDKIVSILMVTDDKCNQGSENRTLSSS